MPPCDGYERRRNFSNLLRARYDGRKLASLRRAAGAFLVGVGSLVVVLSQCVEGRIGRAMTILTAVWLCALLTMIGVLQREWRNRVRMEALHLACLGDDDDDENRASRSSLLEEAELREPEATRAVSEDSWRFNPRARSEMPV